MGEQYETQLSALFVAPIADLLRGWTLAGKLDEDDLDRALGANAQALLDHPMDPSDWAQLSDIEGMVGLAASELGGEAGLVEWADDVVSAWMASGEFSTLLESARALIDSEGFAVSQASALFVRDPRWQYEGGVGGFSVRVGGVAEASPALKALLGGFLSRLAERVSEASFDVRVEGVDGVDGTSGVNAADLVIFGEAETESEGGTDPLAKGRLHRAALIP